MFSELIISVRYGQGDVKGTDIGVSSSTSENNWTELGRIRDAGIGAKYMEPLYDVRSFLNQ